MKELSLAEIVEVFYNNHYDLYTKMCDTEHGYADIMLNPFHLEGSVWAHTTMVMKQSEELPTTFKLASLCHDIGKCFTLEDNPETERRSFKCHEAVSTFYAREVLRSFDLDYDETERIIKIIANHGSLYNFFKDGRIPRKHYKTIVNRYSWDDFADMVKFYYCDHLGRITSKEKGSGVGEDFDAILELMEIEHDFELAIRTTKIIKGTLILLIGPSGSGKSTEVERLLKERDSVVISRDALVEKYGTGTNYSECWKSLDDKTQKIIDNEIQSTFQVALRNEENIIIDMTNLSAKSRKKWLNDSKTKNYFKQAIVFLNGVDELKYRNKNRCLKTGKCITEDILMNQLKRFVYPNNVEFDKIVHVW